MRAKRWKGLWLLDILQKYAEWEEFTHTELYMRFGNFERLTGITFRSALRAATHYGFLKKVRQIRSPGGGGLIWIYQVPLKFQIQRDTDIRILLNPCGIYNSHDHRHNIYIKSNH